ncbi:hypothetical protein FIU87_06545 [Bacillus sp. THAF10]|uniref:IDEAL domain-containing protein n=1 Tax=Bacillus sp. THAF10 TaxID=2587848 RepID=UPI0012694ED8|nr:IDEAL domain-containing protein [Bacillus sp. THAF10]QFT88295.1 hypothetical protein FIU87_06545 [Bacillus sp. THAF10]
MKNEKSYTELMKSRKMNKKVSVEAYMMNVYVQMIIDESYFHYQKNLLQRKIDDALDSNDAVLFQHLSIRYKKFMAEWGA